MLLSKRNTQISVVITVFFMSLATCLINKRLIQTLALQVSQAAVCSSSLAMIYAIFVAHPKHKSKFMIFFLASTMVFFTWLFVIIQYYIHALVVSSRYKLKYATYITGSLLYTGLYSKEMFMNSLCKPTITAFLGFLMHIMYKEYVNLTEGTVEPVQTEKQPLPIANLQIVAISKKI